MIEVTQPTVRIYATLSHGFILQVEGTEGMTSNSKLHHTIMLWMGEWAVRHSLGIPFYLELMALVFETSEDLGKLADLDTIYVDGTFAKCDQVS